MFERSFRRAALLLASVSATGCAISQPAVPVDRYLAGDFAAVRQFAEQEVADGDTENLGIVLNVLGQCQLAMGDIEAAFRTFLQAGQIMGNWSVSGGEVTAALVGSESSKTYKGDPYEKAMNAVYLAYCCLKRGDFGRARASIKRGILADAEVGDEKYQADNALLFWMEGRMSLLNGNSDAERAFAEARTANEFALAHGARGEADNPILANPAAGNLVLLLPIGLGPEKYAEGVQGELARFREQSHPAVMARATLDGGTLGSSWLICDVNYQARTLGGTEMEGIRQGKAVFKTAATVSGAVLLTEAARNPNSKNAQTQAIVGGSLLLVGLFTSASADVRHWPSLASSVHVIAADASPGEHELIVDFLDAGGRELRNLRHVMRIVVAETGETWLLIPSLPPLQSQP